MFNYMIEHRDFPETWTEGLRSPIFKSGAKLETVNYRGMTVLPIFEKLFEIAVQKRLEFVSEAFKKTIDIMAASYRDRVHMITFLY